MGLFNLIFGKDDEHKQPSASASGINMFSTSCAIPLTSVDTYELDITRAAIHAIANACSKLVPFVEGKSVNASKYAHLLTTKPDAIHTKTQWIYRIATILATDTTALIVPVINPVTGAVMALYPMSTSGVEVFRVDGAGLWARVYLPDIGTKLIEFERLGILTNYSYKNELFGDGNAPIADTLQVLKAQSEGVRRGITDSARVDWIANTPGNLRDEDLEDKRERFSRAQLSSSNTSRLIMVDDTVQNLQRVEYRPWTPATEEMRRVQSTVLNYFGVSEAILQNSGTEEDWCSFYEGKVEPFAAQLSEVLTQLMFTDNEIYRGNAVRFSGSALDYMSMKSKLELACSFTDRGAMSMDEARRLLGFAPIEGGAGNQYAIRGEYVSLETLKEHSLKDVDTSTEQAKDADKTTEQE